MTRYLLILVLLSLTPMASADESPWVKHMGARTRIISATPAVERGQPLYLGWQIQLEEGWKVYWRSPGEAGKPPILAQAADSTLAGFAYNFPAPNRFELFGLQTFGYGDEMVLPITAQPSPEGTEERISVSADFMICSDICVPHEATYTLTLEKVEGTPLPSVHAQRIFQARETVPDPLGDDGAGLALETAQVAGPVGKQRLLVTASADRALTMADVFVETSRDVVLDAPRRQLRGDGTEATFVFEVLEAPSDLAGRVVTITVVDGHGAAIERRVTLESYSVF